MMMTSVRVIVSAVLVTTFAITGAAAQTFGYGGKVGATLSTVKFDGENSLTVSAKTAVVGGGFVTLRLASKLIVEADVFYSVRKSEFEGIVVDTLTYIDVPVLLHIPIASRPRWGVHALAGGTAAFLKKGEEVVGSFESEDITDRLESFEASAVVGAEVTLWRRWLVDFRYSFGLSDIYVAPNFSGKTRSFLIMGGYKVR